MTATGRIIASGRDVGTGFAVTPRVVLTAGHVVRERSARSLQFVLADHDPISVTDSTIDEALDVGALRLTDDVPATPLVGRATTGARWIADAQPRSNDPQLDGVIKAAKWSFTNKRKHQVDGIQLDVEQELGDYSGYSGSPILSEEGVAVGLLVEQLPRRENASPGEPSRASNVLYAVSVLDAIATLGIRLDQSSSTGGPVFDHLTQRFLEAGTEPDPVLAHVLAQSAGHAYSDEVDNVQKQIAHLGLIDNVCAKLTSRVDELSSDSTVFLVQSADGRVLVVCYRGTPFRSYISKSESVRTVLQLSQSDASFHVDADLYRNFRATRDGVVGGIERARAGESVTVDRTRVPNKLQALIVTGHGVGGALAALLAIMLRDESAFAEVADMLRAVYTFGAPMIGSPELRHVVRS